MKKTSLLIIALILFGCHAIESETISLEGIPVITPNLLHEYDGVSDDDFFAHLAYKTIVLDDGTIFLGDRETNRIYKIKSNGNLVDVLAREGRGPGEFRDITSISRSFDGSVIVYDQFNSKVIRFDQSGNFMGEYVIRSRGEGMLTEVFDINEEQLLLTYRILGDFNQSGVNPQQHIVAYQKETEVFQDYISIASNPIAWILMDGQPVGGRVVPFTAANLLYFNHSDASIYSYYSDGTKIVQLSADFDTLSTVRFELTAEILSEEDITELRDDTSPDQWPSLAILLPEYKAIAEDFKLDDENRFWLRLNHRSDYQKWLVLSSSGEKLAIVQFPESGILTHISSQHIGYRLDDHLFGIFETINLP